MLRWYVHAKLMCYRIGFLSLFRTSKGEFLGLKFVLHRLAFLKQTMTGLLGTRVGVAHI